MSRALSDGSGSDPLELASSPSEELVLLLLRELLLVAARAAQVRSGGPPVVDNYDALVGPTRRAPAVLAVLHFFLLVMHSVCLVISVLCRDG